MGTSKIFLISTYRESKGEQFVLEVIGETTYMGEPAYIVKHDYEHSPCKEIFKEDNTPVRKSLIGADGLYDYYTPKPEQLTLF